MFRGKLGSEQDAIAVGLIEMSAPGFIFNPSNTPSDGLEGTRYIYKGNGQWTLGDIQGLVSGNTDWKGWYVNGKPTKAVSWQGPKSRYFPDGAPFTPNIYYNGELYSVAPYPVLGAALNQDASGNTWIVAICQNGSNDVVLKRPLTRNTSTELYDPQFHPEGWRMLEEFTPLSGFLPPDRPWFFNGTGTQAQTLRKSNTPLTGGLERMKITILQDSATIDHLGNLPGKSSYGNVGGNGCISQQNTDWNCSGSIANPTGRFVTDIVRENRYGRDYGARGSYIVAVDYLDDRETLAILSLEDSFDETIFWGEDSHNTGTCYLENTANRIYSTTQNRKNKALYAQVQKQVLSLSSDKLGMLVINQLDFTRSSNWPNSTWKCPELEITPFDYTQCQSEDHQAHTIDKKETIRRIDFMDLRNGTALVSESATDNLFSSHIDAYNQSWTDATEVVTTDSTTKTSRYQLMLGDEPITLYAYNETTPGAQISTLPTPPGGWNINTLCRQESSSGESDTYTSMTTTVSIPLNPPTVSMASDSSGNIFASIQIIDEDNNPRVFNFLTNADPDQVIGITETGTTYYPIGLK